MKRRIFAVVLCLAMMMAMAVPAFADTTLTGQVGENETLSSFGDGYSHELGNDYTIDVVGKLDANENGIPDEEETDPTPVPETPKVAIDVYWTDMVFTYKQSWDDVDLTYIWTWQNGEDYVRVDNRSSVGVDVSVSFTGDSTNGYDDSAVEFVFDSETAIAGSWDGSKLTLGYGNQATEEQLAEDAELVVAPSGTLNVNVADTTTMATGDGAAAQVTLGQITVNVTVAEEAEPVETVNYLRLDAGTTEYEINFSKADVLTFEIYDAGTLMNVGTNSAGTKMMHGETELALSSEWYLDTVYNNELAVNEFKVNVLSDNYVGETLTLTISATEIGEISEDTPLSEYSFTVTIHLYA